MENKKSLKPFFAIWTGQAVSLLGSMLVQFALIWWLTKTTGSATVLAMAAMAGFLPQVLLGPFAGVLVDRWNRKTIMVISDSLVALATMVLVYLFWAGTIQVWHIFAILVVRSIAGTFQWPAMMSSTSLMVPKEQLTRIQGFNQALNGALNIASAPLGAALLEILPMQGVLAIDIVTALVALVTLLFVSIPQPERAEKTADSAAPSSSFWTEMKAGLRYIRAWPGLMVLTGLAMSIKILLNPAFSLLPLLVKDHFQGTAWHLGALESTWGVGVIAGGLLLGAWGGFGRRTITMLVGLIGIGVGLVVLGLTPASFFALAVAAMVIAGVAVSFTDGPLMAILQTAVAPEMQGRVFMLFGSLVSSTVPVGLMLAGPVSDAFGVQLWFILAGVVTMIGGVVGFLIPAFLNLEENRQEGDKETAVPLTSAVAGD